MPKIKSKNAAPQLFNKLFLKAKNTLANAYSPYSNVKVACSVLMNDGKIYTGCNVENSSYGATICAERVAVTKAISHGAKKIKAVLVVTNQKQIWPPCGVCRQVISEFATPATVVFSADLNKNFNKNNFSELLPGSFSIDHFDRFSKK